MPPLAVFSGQPAAATSCRLSRLLPGAHRKGSAALPAMRDWNADPARIDGTNAGCVAQPQCAFCSCANGYFMMDCCPNPQPRLCCYSGTARYNFIPVRRGTVLRLLQQPLIGANPAPISRPAVHSTRYLPTRRHFNLNCQLPIPGIPRHSAKQNPVKTATHSAV